MAGSTSEQSISEALAAQVAQARSGPTDPAGIELGAIRVHLWYEETGRLSENIAPPSGFVIFNTIIGAGQAEEVANDILVTVEVLSSGREENVEIPLTIEARDSTGRVLARRVVDSVLTSEQGRSIKGLWVFDAGCAGAVNITASMGRMRKSIQVDFPCGE